MLLDNELGSAYLITQLFTDYCRQGNGEVYTSTSDTGIISLTCKNGNDYNVIIINTQNNSNNATASDLPIAITSLKDSNGVIYPVTSQTANLGILDSPYLESGNGGLLFLDQDLQSPTLTIDSPTSSTYSTTTIYFNITLDEEGDTCVYSLNNFLTNYSMAKQGYVNEFKASAILNDDTAYTVKFWCNDTSGNVNDTESVSFNLDVCGEDYTLDDGNCVLDQDALNRGLGICYPMFSGYSGFFSYAPLFFGIFVVIVILGIVGMIIYAVKNQDSDSNINMAMVISFVFIMGIAAILSVIGIIILNMLCSI